MVTVSAWALLFRSEAHLQPRTRRWAARTRSWSTHIGIIEDVKKLDYLWDRIQARLAEDRRHWSEKDLREWAYDIAIDREGFIRTFMRIGADVLGAGLVRYNTFQPTIEEGEDTSAAVGGGTRLR